MAALASGDPKVRAHLREQVKLVERLLDLQAGERKRSRRQAG
jgi:hypothetical protein